MVTFPVLSVGPIKVDPSPAYDPSLRSQAEDGKIKSRRRYTGDKKQFDILYTTITAADKVLLETMQIDAGIGADTISWTNEDKNDLTAYIVRLSPEGIKFNNRPEKYDLYIAKFKFIEA